MCDSNDTYITIFISYLLLKTSQKSAIRTRFARVGTARGWGLAYQASSINLPHQSHNFDPALKASGARRKAVIQ